MVMARESVDGGGGGLDGSTSVGGNREQGKGGCNVYRKLKLMLGQRETHHSPDHNIVFRKRFILILLTASTGNLVDDGVKQGRRNEPTLVEWKWRKLCKKQA